jgi:hypothetical protein
MVNRPTLFVRKWLRTIFAFMPQTIVQKLRIKEEMKLLTLYAPDDFAATIQSFLKDVTISSTGKKYDQVHWFVTSQTQLKDEVEKVVKMIGENITCWVYYPKLSSKIKTDLTRDKGWEPLLKHTELQWLSLVAFDDTWSAFGFRLQTEADETKVSTKQPREIFNYVDPVKKTVQLPEDLAAAFKTSKEANDLFDTLSFTNKKEYIEWIVTAKQEATRTQRIDGTIERLRKGWKNPANR